MKIFEIINPAPYLTESKGREFNHVEDLLFFYGSDGAERALNTIESWANSQEDLSIKWDGKLALYYGRDDNGVFSLGTIGNWRKSGPQRSAEEIENYVLNGGQGEDWRKGMAAALSQSFDALEQSVPQNFRGFVKGDVLYAPVMAPVKKTRRGLEFTSNKVTYVVDPKSNLGQRIKNTSIGIACHVVYDEWGSSNANVIQPEQVEMLNSNDVLALGQTYVAKNPSIDQSMINQTRSLVKKHKVKIDEILPGFPGMADMGNILYRYSNQSAAAGMNGNLSIDHFSDWLTTSKVSKPKQERIQEILLQLDVVLQIYNQLVHAKNDVIDQLDDMNTDVQAFTGDQRGGEGYVSLKTNTKLVPRHRWTPT